MVKIDFLFWKDCPSHQEAWDRLLVILNQMNIRAELQRIEVNTHEEAIKHAFPGSPTIRINGHDIDPEGALIARTGLSCRIYRNQDGRGTPLPPEQSIRHLLETEFIRGEN